MKLEKAVLGAGCFWHVEEFFSNIKGVNETRVGYACGVTKNPTYKEVCTGETGHVEVVEVIFDPTIIKYNELLNKFWHMHDPTSIDKQGPDIGSQYKSTLCVFNESQNKVAKKSKKEIQKFFDKPKVTLICMCKIFYPAEEYHQKYLKKNIG